MNTFILSQFNYCPLIWMFCERQFNNKVNHLHEMALRIAYKDDNSDFTMQLEKGNAVKIHIKNLQLLVTEQASTLKIDLIDPMPISTDSCTPPLNSEKRRG